jgi:ABC-type multidrug transport system permease subunit
LPMAFLSGSFGPASDLPGWLQAIADVLPLQYFMRIVNGVILRDEPAWADGFAILVVAAWGLAGAAVAWRRFSWQPRDR